MLVFHHKRHGFMIYSKHEEIPVQYWKFLMKKGRMTLLLMWLKYKIFLFEKEGGGTIEKERGGGGTIKREGNFDRGEIPSCLYET